MGKYELIEEAITKIRGFDKFNVNFTYLGYVMEEVNEYLDDIKFTDLFYEQSRCYFLIALIELIIKEDKIAINNIEKAISLLNRSDIRDEKYEAILKGYRIRCCFDCYNTRKFKDDYKDVEELFIKLELYEELLNLNLSILEFLISNVKFHDDIDKYLEKNYNIVKLNKINDLEYFYFIVGYIHINIFNDVVSSLFYLLQALEMASKSKSIKLEARIRVALGECYRVRENQSEKIRILKPLIEEEKYKELDQLYKNIITQNIIEAYLEIEDFNKAKELIGKIEKTSVRSEKYHFNFILLYCKIKYYMKTSTNNNQVYELYQKFINIYNKIKTRCFFRNIEYYLENIEGEVYYYLGKYEKSFEIHTRLLKESIEKDDKICILEYYQKLSMDCEKLGDIKNASKFLKKHIKLKKEWYKKQSELYSQILLREYDINNKNEEISKLISIKEKLTDIRNMDVVTGIFNRRFLEEIITDSKDTEKLLGYTSVLMIDVDFFKKYNDNYGHLKGDEVLRSVGNILSKVCNDDDKIPIRYGGEEFICILYNTDYKKSIKVAKDILYEIRNAKIEHKYSEVNDIVTVSIGISTMQDEKNYLRLIKEADEALYLAKNNGKDRYIHVKDS